MFSFFKRSKNRGNDKQRKLAQHKTSDACAGTADDQRENHEQSDAATATASAQVLPHRSHQYDNESVGERAAQPFAARSTTAPPPPPPPTKQKQHGGGGGFFGDIMAKGRNRRNHNNNNNYSKSKPKTDAPIITIKHKINNDIDGVPRLLLTTTAINNRHQNFDEKRSYEIVENDGDYQADIVKTVAISPSFDTNVVAAAAADDAAAATTNFVVKNNSIRCDRRGAEIERNSVAIPSLNNMEQIAYDVDDADVSAQYRDDRNSEQIKQDRSTGSGGGSDGAQQPLPSSANQTIGVLPDELVKQIIFEKYKRPVSPPFATLSAASHNFPSFVTPQPSSTAAAATSPQQPIKPSQALTFDAIMGQQPTKHNQNHPNQCRIQPTETTKTPSRPTLPVFVAALHSQPQTPPSSSPTDDKEVFYEADDDIEIQPTTVSDLSNDIVNLISPRYSVDQLNSNNNNNNNNDNSLQSFQQQTTNENRRGIKGGNVENSDINNSDGGQVPRNRSVSSVRFAIPDADENEVEHEINADSDDGDDDDDDDDGDDDDDDGDDDDDDDEDDDDDNEANKEVQQQGTAVVVVTEHHHNSNANSHNENTIFKKNINDPDHEDANYDDRNDDDDDNDSPDSGIDIVTDIADISQILQSFACESTAAIAPSSLSSSMISSSISIDTSCSNSSVAGGLCYNGTATGHTGTLSSSSSSNTDFIDHNNRTTQSDSHPNRNGFSIDTTTFDGRSNNGVVSDSSAFNSTNSGGSYSSSIVQPSDCGTTNTDIERKREKSVDSDSDDELRRSVSDEFDISPRKLASLYNNGDIAAVSLPDIVESIGNTSSTNGTSNGTAAMVSAATSGPEDTPVVLRANGAHDAAVTSAAIKEAETKKPANGNEMKDLVNQEARFAAQLEEAEKQALTSQTKANDLSYQINELERNLTVKTWNVERLQAELQAAYKEGEAVKKKLKLQEAEMEALRYKHSEQEDALTTTYTDLQQKYNELLEKFGEAQRLVSDLQSQLQTAENDATTVRHEREQCLAEHRLQQQQLQASLDAAVSERHSSDTKWHTDFEQLRTHHSDREEHLMQDCEWKLRSTEQACKAKVVAAETAKREALEKVTNVETESKRQMQEVKHLKSYEAEVAQLRGLTGTQADAITHMTQKLDDLKSELEDANKTVAESIETVRKIQFQCKQELGDKNRQMIYRIDEARGEVAVMWEDRLMEEMSRLKVELESCYAEDRAESLQIAHAESLEEIEMLTASFNAKEKELRDEIAELKRIVADRNIKLEEANDRSDKQVMQIRVILDRSEREHQREMNAEIAKRDMITESMRADNEHERQEMEERFRERLMHVTDEFATELTNNKEELQARHKKKMEQQFEKLMAEKEEAIQDLERKHKRQLIDAETKLRDIEITHQRSLKDIKSHQSMEQSSFEQRDLQSAQEIETLHKKCRCLTKLFEEMRMRYERRDPRPEDLRDIEELKSRIEAQDRDLRKLTEKLRELQIVHQQQQQQQQQVAPCKPPKSKKSKVNCNVIYEENEDREASPTQLLDDESHV